jgi:diguanylate cyclase (GGDEF)-like protein
MGPRFADVLSSPARTAAILAAAGGGVSLAAWALSSPGLEALFPGAAPIHPLTPLSFFLLGISLWFVRPLAIAPWDTWAGPARFIPALLVLAMAGVRLAAYIRGIGQGLPPGEVATPLNSVALSGALCFALLGLALLFFDNRSSRRVEGAQLLFLGTGILAMAALVGRSFGLSAAPGLGTYSAMPLSTALGLLLLVAGFLAENFEGGLLNVVHTDSAGGVMARRFLPAAVLVPPLLGYLCWLGEQGGLYSSNVRLLLFAMSNVIIFGALILRTARSLHLTDRERQRAQNALQQSNEMLTEWVRELEMRNKEATLLNEMGDLLQTCLTTEEACGIITKFALRLFPNDSGALLVCSTAKNLVEAMAVWGGYEPQEPVFAPEDCWALRSGRIHRVDDPVNSPLCAHIRKTAPSPYLCVPMVAQGEAIGVLHIQTPAPTAGGPPAISDAKQRLALSVAEHVGLALASLRLRETLHIQSIRDPLTGLYNRRYMEESLEREIRRADRKKRPLPALMIDIDNFKRFNDTLGHAAGDALLRATGTFLQSRMRKDDIVCRYGGEEFTIIMPESSVEVAQQRAERLREDVKKLDISLNGQFLGSVSFSVGLACFPQNGASGEEILRAADLALYRAKSSGRDCVVVAEHIDELPKP